MKLTTLIYIEDQDDWLMLHRVKKANDINENMWVGVGGKFEYGESPLECAQREVQEETGQELLAPVFQGFVTFFYADQEPMLIMVYTGRIGSRDFSETNEGVLAWIPKDQVLDLDLWEGDQIFIRAIMADQGPFDLKFYYDDNRQLMKVEEKML